MMKSVGKLVRFLKEDAYRYGFLMGFCYGFGFWFGVCLGYCGAGLFIGK